MSGPLEKARDAGFTCGKIAFCLLFSLVFLMLFTEVFSSRGREPNESVRPQRVSDKDLPGLATLDIGLTHDQEPVFIPSASVEDYASESRLIPGDILLGRCKLSPVPSLNPMEGWTHACMYMGDGQIIVASQPGEGVVKSSLRSWMYPDMTWVCYLRVASAGEKTREEAVDYVVSMRGQPYDMNWFSKQPDGSSWYCSELVWAAYFQASGGRINLAQSPDLFGISPDEIYASDHTVCIGGHYERKPDTILSMMMKVFALCVLAGGMGMVVESAIGSRNRRWHGNP